MGLSKKLAQRIHAKRRLQERYGLNFTTIQLKALERQIREGQARIIHRSSNTRTIWMVSHEGIEMRAVYHKGRGIVTILPVIDSDVADNKAPIEDAEAHPPLPDAS